MYFCLLAIATVVGQQQQFGGAPMAQVPQPPQYNAAADGPPPYTQAQFQGAAGATAPMEEEKKNAF